MSNSGLKKGGAAAAGIGVLGIILHLVHLGHTMSEAPDNKTPKFDKVTIVVTDSVTGKQDTIDIEDYLKRKSR